MIKIKNWQKFQHYKTNQPRWIKLHSKLLGDPDWFALAPTDAWLLVNLWLLAAESEEHDGSLPSLRKIAFRLRTTEAKILCGLKSLTHWVLMDARTENVESSTENVESSTENVEARTENVESSTENVVRGEENIVVSSSSDFKKNPQKQETTLGHFGFEAFWKSYPRKKKKGDAERAWQVLKPSRELQQVMAEAIERAKTSKDWRKDNGQFIPYPATWLRARGWEDEDTVRGNGNLSPEEFLEQAMREGEALKVKEKTHDVS